MIKKFSYSQELEQMNENKRILIIIPDYTAGGAEVQLRHIIYRLNEEAIPTDVYITHSFVCGHDELLARDRRSLNNIKIHEFDLYHRTEEETRWEIYNYVAAQGGGSKYKAALLFHEVAVPMIPLLKSIGIPTIYSERREGIEVTQLENYRRSLDICDSLCCNSSAAKARMEAALRREVTLIRNGKEKKERLKRSNRKIRNIVVPCRIDPSKNLEVILRFAEKYKDENYKIRIIGKITDHKYGERILRDMDSGDLSETVTIAGYSNDMKREYENADLVVLPSLREGTPNIVLEAFAYERAVAVSDIEPEWELVEDDRLRFEPHSEEGLYGCIKYIESLTDQEYENMLEKHKKLVNEKYDLKKMTDHFLLLFSETAGRPAGTSEIEWLDEVRSDLLNLGSALRKQMDFYEVLCKWVGKIQSGHTIPELMDERNYHKVSIYGYKELGELLYQALDGSDVQIVQVIDKNGKSIETEQDIVLPDAINDEGVDVMVVTALSAFQQICRDLKARYRFEVISIHELLG